MKHIRCRNACILVTGVFALGCLQAQAAEKQTPVPAIQDWSSHGVIHRQPLTPDELEAVGRSRDMQQLYRDPRYVASLLRRIESENPTRAAAARTALAPAASAKSTAVAAECNERRDRRNRHPTPNGGCDAPEAEAEYGNVQRDWSYTLGNAAGGRAGVFPAKYSFDIFDAPSCANDFVVYTTNAAASASQASIVSFNQLYQGSCNGPWNNNGAIKAPNVMWAYNTGTGYITETSPVLSYLDGGKQVAYVQRNTSTGDLQLVLLKWQADQGTPTAPVTLTASTSAAAYRGCASGCYYAIPFAGTSNTGNAPTYSAPFVNYSGDILWAGDGNGNLHKFTGVFQGQPAEVTSGGFPKTVEAGLSLSPPTADLNGFVFVGSQSGGGGAGGKLYRIDADNGNIVATSSKLALANTSGLREAPIIDLFTGSVYVYVFNDNTTNYTDPDRCADFESETDGCRAIFRFDRLFGGNTSGTRAWIGRGNSTTRALYRGGFDEEFYTSDDGSGNLYVVGGRPDNTFYATLWKVPINANGALGTPVRGPEFGARDRYVEGAGAQSGTDNPQNLSPVTVIKNPHTGMEYVFASTASYGNDNGCGDGTHAGGACLYMYALNQQVTSANAQETWTLRIAAGSWSWGSYSYRGIADSGNRGSISINGTTVNFSSAGDRSDDRDALRNAINTQVSGYNAANSGTDCTDGYPASTTCDLIITRAAYGDVSDNTLTHNLNNVGQPWQAHTNGAVAGTSIQPVAFNASLNPSAALQVSRGTGGIVVDNVRPDTDAGASQIYFAQVGVPGTPAVPGTKAYWTTTVGNINTNSNNRTYTVTTTSGTRTFTGNGSTTNCPSTGNGTFNVSGTSGSDDAGQLRACLASANLAGFTVSGSGTQVIVTSTTNGSKSSSLVNEQLSNTDTNFVNGTADTAAVPGTGNAIQASQSGLQ